jgi:hypothetical protein
LRKTLELSPGDPVAPQILTDALLSLGEEPERFVGFLGASAVEDELRAAYRAGGARAFYKRALELEIARSGKPCTNFPSIAAVFFAKAEDDAGAFECLNRAADVQGLPLVGASAFSPYHSDPRFQTVLKRMGLEEYYE